MKELLGFIDLQDKRLIDSFGKNTSPTERTHARTIKLMEELGELCNEILAHDGDQRKDKLDKVENDGLPFEFADVLITTLLLAKSMNVDIEDALMRKIEKINKRYK